MAERNIRQRRINGEALELEDGAILQGQSYQNDVKNCDQAILGHLVGLYPNLVQRPVQ